MIGYKYHACVGRTVLFSLTNMPTAVVYSRATCIVRVKHVLGASPGTTLTFPSVTLCSVILSFLHIAMSQCKCSNVITCQHFVFHLSMLAEELKTIHHLPTSFANCDQAMIRCQLSYSLAAITNSSSFWEWCRLHHASAIRAATT